MKLGSSYSEWNFHESTNLERSSILSCGVGEDISFELEFAAKYAAKVYFVDPTERAINHVLKTIERCGERNEMQYSDSGFQDVRAYDLSNIEASQLILFPFAVYDQECQAKFYSPTDSSHVSFTLEGELMGTKGNDYVYVQTIRIPTLVKHIDGKFNILKMDIEGVAIKVLNDILKNGTYFKQILVEFEELKHLNLKRLINFIKIHKKLEECDYILIKVKSKLNFTYLRKI